MRGEGMFTINSDQIPGMHQDQKLKDEFKRAEKEFDEQTHESMTRKPIQTEDVKKMVDPAKVVVACLLLSGVKKTVDRLVR